MSESGGGGFTQPTSPTSGLAPYGSDHNPKAERVKSRLKRLARQHRVHTAMRKSEELTMNTYEQLLTDLRTAVVAAAAAPEAEREEILGKAFNELDEGLTAEVEAAIQESASQSDPLISFTHELAKSAGTDDELAKGLSDVADFAFALQNIERMIERMAAITEGKMSFPSMLSEHDLSDDDSAAQKEHAHAILDIVTPFYSMGLVVLQRLTGATVADEHGEAMSAEDEDEVLKADMGAFFAGVSNLDVSPEVAYELLNKAFTPPTTDPNDDTSPDDGQDGMDDGDVDPLETIKRLAAAIMLQISAISDSDDGSDDGSGDPQDAAPGQSGPSTGSAPGNAGMPPAITKADLAQLMKSEVENQLGQALSPLQEEIERLTAENERLGKMAAPNAKGQIDPSGRSEAQVTLENLSKMDPEAARREVFKAALSNPLG